MQLNPKRNGGNNLKLKVLRVHMDVLLQSLLSNVSGLLYHCCVCLPKNQEEFDKIVKGATCSPIIDFEKHTLLIGVETLNSGYSGIEYNLKKITTDKDTLVLTVRFHVNGATVMSEPTWHVLLPKSVEGIPIKVNFEKK